MFLNSKISVQSMTPYSFASPIHLPADIRLTHYHTRAHNAHWQNWGFRFAT